jgi:DNA-binding SARP family transcriptional activator/tetratricopeptide (TPR) repeat protein
MIRLLGLPRIETDGMRFVDLPARAFVLVALLVLDYPGGVRRDRLAARLWERADRERASVNLRWLLAAIRRWETNHGVRLVRADRTSVEFSGAPVDIAVLTGPTEELSDAAVDDLLDGYDRGFLEGFADGLDDELVGWVEDKRNALGDHWRMKLLRISENRPPEQAVTILRRLMLKRPDDEAVFRALLIAMFKMSGAPAVSTELDEFLRHLQAMKKYPSPETLALAARLTGSVPAAATAEILGHPAPDPRDNTGMSDRGIPRVVLFPPTAPLGCDPITLRVGTALVDDVVIALCRMRQFAMLAPYTAHQLSVGTASLAVNANYIGTTQILPSSQSPGRLGFSLTAVETGRIAFADHLELDNESLPDRFAQLSEAVARAVSVAVEASELTMMRRTGVASAYVHCLLGSRDIPSMDLREIRRAGNHYRRALDLDRYYIPALTGLARSLTKQSLLLREPQGDHARQGADHAERAKTIDPLNAETWRELARASIYQRDLDAGLEYIDEAMSRAPHHADILAEKAELLIHLSRPRDAQRLIGKAIELNPLAPDEYLWTKGSAEFLTGGYADAVATLVSMRQRDAVSRLISAAAAMAGQMGVARSYRRRWLSQHPGSTIEDAVAFIPLSKHADIDPLVEGLRLAGFPER